MAANTRRLRAVPGVAPAPIRCAIYTRKSTEGGLEQPFNSLDAQREAGEKYIEMRRNEGWVLLPEHYDDGGFTGSNTQRPALKRLLNDVVAHRVDCVVVYKYDRLSRSLLDFLKMMEMLGEHNVAFVSITQQIDTTTPSGRLLGNTLATFAQYELETISERTRDKMHAARRKGRFIGGNLVLGYDVAPQGGELMVNAMEAERVRHIYRLYLELGSLIPVLEELDRREWRMKEWVSRQGTTRGGARFSKTTLYNLLTNVTYTGRVLFQGTTYHGQHERIVDDDTFNRVQEQLSQNGRGGKRPKRNKLGALLKGLVQCRSCGSVMIHTYTKKPTTLYRYYVCANAHQRGWNKCATRSVSAPELEGAVIQNLRGFVQDPAMLSEILQRIEEAREPSAPIADPAHVQEALRRFDPLWEHLTTSEREQFIRALVVHVKFDGVTGNVTVGFRSEGIKEICEKYGATA